MSVDVLYAINAKTEPAGSLSPEITGVPATLTGSSISIANLLTYVNRYFPDVLPESVLRHFGHSERPAGKLGEGATAVSGAELCERQFQSTPPARGATHTYTSRPQTANHFNPHPPRGGRLSRCTAAPTGGYFNPRPPRGGRQYYLCQACHTRSISIHAPREGGDGDQGRRRCAVLNFNPRPPRGGRR